MLLLVGLGKTYCTDVESQEILPNIFTSIPILLLSDAFYKLEIGDLKWQ